jgi:hypothetical protein
MTDQTTAALAWVAHACTLPTAEQPLRLAEFDAMFVAAVRGEERLGPQHLRLTLAGGADVAEAVRDLAARESECCSFFTFTVSAPHAGEVRLDIEVPAGHTAALDALAQRATTTRGRA